MSNPTSGVQLSRRAAGAYRRTSQRRGEGEKCAGGQQPQPGHSGVCACVCVCVCVCVYMRERVHTSCHRHLCNSAASLSPAVSSRSCQAACRHTASSSPHHLRGANPTPLSPPVVKLYHTKWARQRPLHRAQKECRLHLNAREPPTLQAPHTQPPTCVCHNAHHAQPPASTAHRLPWLPQHEPDR